MKENTYMKMLRKQVRESGGTEYLSAYTIGVIQSTMNPEIPLTPKQKEQRTLEVLAAYQQVIGEEIKMMQERRTGP